MTFKKSGVALGLAMLVAIGSAALLLDFNHMPCEQRAPLTVLATLAAFVIAFCLRQFSQPLTRTGKSAILGALLLSAVCLFADARFVVRYREICNAPLPTVNGIP